MTRDPTSSIHLRRSGENGEEIDAAVAQLGARVGLRGVLDHLDRQARRTPVPGRAVEWGFRWDDADASSRRWWPQGITTSADAGDTEDFGGRRLLLTSWYSKKVDGQQQGSRITVVDLDSLQYRHVLLVTPARDRRGRIRLRPLSVHAGGLVWCGPYLHVAGTERGLFSFLLEDLMRMSSAEHTFGYRYVLPVRFCYEAVSSEGVQPMRYSFLSLDRTAGPPHLVAGEYGVGDLTRRLVRYPLDAVSHHLVASEDNAARPVWLEERGVGHMQGTAVVRDVCYATASRGSRRRGRMFVGVPGRFRGYAGTLPPGPEDIAYWPSTDRLWSVSEHPGGRFVFAMERSWFDRHRGRPAPRDLAARLRVRLRVRLGLGVRRG